MTKKVSKESLNISEEKIAELKKVIPEVFTEGKIDFEKLQRTLGEEINGKDEKYSFNWAGRKETFKNIQTTAKGTLKPAEKESVNWDSTENLFVEGDNLEVLKLLQKAYFNKIKMIYIDPPYNTGNDFVYKDDFKHSIKSYLQQTGQLNGNGIKLTTNPETNGRFHSDWMSMIYPRLFIARNLLRDDGVIFISIDDNEVHNLRKMLDEIFGEENFVTQFPWRKRTAKSDVPFGVSQDYEWILTYAKSDVFKAKIKGNGRKYYETDDLPNRPWRIHGLTTQRTASERPNSNFTLVNPKNKKEYPVNPNAVWRITKDSFKKYLKEKRIVFPGDYDFLKISQPVLRYFKDEDKLKDGDDFGHVAVSTLLPNKVGMTLDGTKESSNLFGGKIFSFPKPKGLIKFFLEISTNNTDIVLDFFAGSATTAHAVLEQNKEDKSNRKFICVQLPEPTDKKSDAYKAGFKIISDIAKERIRKVITEIEKEQKEKSKQKKLTEDEEVNLDLGFKVFKLDKSNYKIWEKYEGQDAKELKKQLELFKTPLISGYKNDDVIYECIIKEGYSLNSKIEKTDVKSNKVFKVTDGDLFFYISLDQEIKDNTIDELKLKKENMFICLDEALNDSNKKNLSIQCNLKTI